MAPEIGFNGGLTCAMQCLDLDKAIAWYQDTLGFSLIYRVEDIGWCELKSPVARVTIGLAQVKELDVKGGATLTFEVDDIDHARSQIESKDVPFDGATETFPGMVKLATFYDLNGNKLMLFQCFTDS